MSELPLLTLVEAFLVGMLHALKPCAHSWPMLLPFLGKGRRVLFVAVPFAVGAFLASLVAGLIIGGVAGTLPGEWRHHSERIIGAVLLILGLIMLVRPRFGHFGHVHGDCEPGHEPHCSHTAHDPRRYMRTGEGVGLFLLGAFNMAVPCGTLIVACGLAATAESALGSTVVFGTFGLATGLTMLIFLGVLAKGLRLLQQLSGGRAELLLIRISALILIALGLTLVFHWHSHD